MLRPNRGEGEHSYRRNKRKAPQIALTVLIFSTPFCMAESAMASTSSFGRLSESLPQQQQQQTVKQHLANNFLGQRLQTKYSSLSPTLVENLESRLAQYQSQLATLKSKSPLDPDLKSKLAESIRGVEAKISALEVLISTTKRDLATYQRAQDALSEAVEKYNKSTSNTADQNSRVLTATTALTQATDAFNQAQQSADASLTNLNLVKAKTQVARDTLSSADASLTTQIEITNNALISLNNAKATTTQKAQALQQAQQTFTQAQQVLANATEALEQAQQNQTNASSNLSNLINAKLEAEATHQEAVSSLLIAQDAYATALANKEAKQSAYDTAHAEVSAQIASYNQLIDVYNNVYQIYLTKQSAYETAQQNLSTAQQTLSTAQHNYDTLLIPDPNWTAPTQQVEHTRQVPVTEMVATTTTTTTQSENILPALTHTTWAGAGTGFQGAQPTINNGVVKFSYSQQTVSYSGTAQIAGNTPLVLSVSVKNQDANRGIQDTYSIQLITYDANGQQNGSAIYDSPQGWHDWTTRTVEVTPTSDVVSYQVRLTGFDGGFWYGTYGPEMTTPTLSATVTTTTTTYEEVTTYITETYYTTEPVLTQGTIQVQINEGGQATFTAPEGATFTGSNLRYEAKERPECGVNITPQVNGLSQITIQASNGVWGDPCGGWYKHIVGTLTYLGQPTAPLIKNPALLPALQEAQADYDLALANYNTASDEWTQAQANQQSAAQATTDGYNSVMSLAEVSNSAYAELQTAENSYATALTNKSNAESVEASSQVALDLATQNQESAQLTFEEMDAELNKAISDYDIALSNKNEGEAAVASAEAELATAQQNQDAKDIDYVEAISQETKATLTKSEAETKLANAIDEEAQAQQDFNNKTSTLTSAQSVKDIATQDLSTEEANLQVALEAESIALATKSETETKLQISEEAFSTSFDLATSSSDISFTDVEEILNTPIPVPEEGSKEIPVDLSAENLMEVNLEEVDPTELTEEQAEQLKEAALETFETAEAGSPEYEQALDALFLAAQQDDIELPAELAAIPGLAGAVEVLNFLGNAGADMSPQVREQSEKVVVTAVVAAGVAVQAAAGAATSAAVSAGASTGSSGSRRVGK